MESENTIFVLGASKLALAALIPTLLEHTDSIIFVATTSEKLNGISSIIFKDMPELHYNIMYADKNATFNSLKSKISKLGIRVAVINITYPIFNELFTTGNIQLCFSACRNGIFNYMDLFATKISIPTTILCFDNDESLINAAITANNNKNISIYKCVAHSICSDITYNYFTHEAILHTGKECFLFFPALGNEFKKYLKTSYNPICMRGQLRFTESYDEFLFCTKAKLIDVNALHTLVCCIAYYEGSILGKKVTEIASMQFNQLLNENFVINKITDIHYKLYQYHLSALGEKFNELYEIHLSVAQQFVHYLFSSNEIVARGLDITNHTYAAKINQHFPILRSINDHYISKILATIENI